jgi:hypothetical protein
VAQARWVYHHILTPGSESPLTGTQGWRQFLGSKKKMLDAYDRAKDQATAHEVEVFHGRVAEAQVRDWLTGFLPKRYGVTSGYIVSQGQTDKTRLPHFDVIIYDQIESPILWIEDNPDASAAGASRAIPAEYVRSVVEVKVAFNSQAVEKAFEHLSDLEPLYAGVDSPADPYKRFLPQGFSTAIVFFELRAEDRNAWTALAKSVPEPRRIPPLGLILRGHGLRPELAARIYFARSANSPPVPIGPSGRDLLDSIVFSESQFSDNTYLSARLRWTSNEFSAFAFDILAALNGTYRPGSLSSSHGMSWIDSEPSPPSVSPA